MSGEQILVSAVLGFMVILLYFGRFSPAVIFIGAASVFVLTGIISPAESLAGFSNTAVAVMLLLLIMSQIVWRTGFIQWLFQKVIKPSDKYRRFLFQLMPFVGISSAFMNNTPVVAMMIPFVDHWGRQHRISASKLLMPLSWAAILGGMLTLIGTSTNMIVNSLVVENGGESMSILDFTPVGLMIFLSGMAFVLFIGYRTFPERKDPYERLNESPREYITDLVIDQGSPLAGKTIEQASLRSLKHLFLTEIIREGKVIAPVAPGEVLREGDRLILAGRTEAVAEIASNRQGLSIGGSVTVPQAEKLHVVEAVVSQGSSLSRKTVKESNFRGRFDAAILGVHRHGRKIKGKIGKITLQSGDLLLLLTGKDFRSSTSGNNDFYVVSSVRQIHNIELGKSIFIIASIFTCIVLSIAGIVPLFTSLLAVTAIFLAGGITTPAEVKTMINLNILAIAAFALAIGRAVQVTGLGALLAEETVSAFEPLGTVGVLAAVYIITNILAEFITTIAAATIVFPFAAASAVLVGSDPVPFYLAVAYGAAANFLTPVGYQTNLMIFGPGGYKTTDFLKTGLPVKIICALTAITGLGLVYRLF
ncbi:SLC13 family permease [Candidatus Fermentibacteria bacterium]|nr:MAG: SLC13 family permease [Candidatus Fermentibacteria bacterium]